MFSASKRHESTPSLSGNGDRTTVIAHGVKLEGNFTSQGDVRVEGSVEGRVATSGALLVGSEAQINADVKADSAVIAGSIEGNVQVQNQLELKASARVIGDITCETATVEAGAVIQGRMLIGAIPAPELSPRKSLLAKGVSVTSVAV